MCRRVDAAHAPGLVEAAKARTIVQRLEALEGDLELEGVREVRWVIQHRDCTTTCSFTVGGTIATQHRQARTVRNVDKRHISTTASAGSSTSSHLQSWRQHSLPHPPYCILGLPPTPHPHRTYSTAPQGKPAPRLSGKGTRQTRSCCRWWRKRKRRHWFVRSTRRFRLFKSTHTLTVSSLSSTVSLTLLNTPTPQSPLLTPVTSGSAV